MLNRVLYWFITLPGLIKGGCLGIVGVFAACSCLFVASIPAATARIEGQATQTSVAMAQQATQVVLHTTATSAAIAQAATQSAFDASTATAEAHQVATQTAMAAPTATARAYEAATTTALAMQAATSQADADATSTALAQATIEAQQTAEAVAVAAHGTATAEANAQATAAAAQQATAEAQTAAQATATIENYRKKMPKGFWYQTTDGVGVGVGDFRYVQSTSLYDSGKGAKFVAFGIGVFNDSGSRIHVNPINVTLVDLDGNSYSYSRATFDYWSQPLDAVDVLSGNKASGGLVFLIDENSAPAQIVYDIGLFGGTVVVDLTRPPDEAQ
jgi:hypothetical protein